MLVDREVADEWYGINLHELGRISCMAPLAPAVDMPHLNSERRFYGEQPEEALMFCYHPPSRSPPSRAGGFT